jgi:hypothetical protein
MNTTNGNGNGKLSCWLIGLRSSPGCARGESEGHQLAQPLRRFGADSGKKK